MVVVVDVDGFFAAVFQAMCDGKTRSIELDPLLVLVGPSPLTGKILAKFHPIVAVFHIPFPRADDLVFPVKPVLCFCPLAQ